MVAGFSSLLLAVIAVGGYIAGTNAEFKTDLDPLYMFVFGDSYSDSGFNISKAWPSFANPFGNPELNNTSVNGANWVDMTTTRFNTTTIFTWNFSKSGACIDPKLSDGPGLPFTRQISELWNPELAKRPNRAPWTTETSLCGILIGTNDCGQMYKIRPIEEHTDKVIESYFNLVDQLYKDGLRNFYFIDSPPLGYSPKVLGLGKNDTMVLTKMLDTFNSKLKVKSEEWSKKKKDVKSLFFEHNALFRRVLKDHKAYGFKDNTSFGNNMRDVMWRDDYHPSRAMQTIVATNLTQALKAADFPI